MPSRRACASAIVLFLGFVLGVTAARMAVAVPPRFVTSQAGSITPTPGPTPSFQPTPTYVPGDPIYTAPDAIDRCQRFLGEQFKPVRTEARFISYGTLKLSWYQVSNPPSPDSGRYPDDPIWLVGLEIPGLSSADIADVIAQSDGAPVFLDGAYCAFDANTGLISNFGGMAPELQPRTMTTLAALQDATIPIVPRSPEELR